MPLSPQFNDFMQCPICFNGFSHERKPVTLLCSHTCCISCLKSLQCCPFDQSIINRALPENEAILSLLQCYKGLSLSEKLPTDEAAQKYYGIEPEDVAHYCESVNCIKQLALLLKPHQSNPTLSRPMQRKIISLLHCQIIEEEGRSRALRNARSIGERALSELLIKHQDPHTLSANLWAAVRARGCQFLGPAMQEEVLRLVLLALEDGSALSRKVLVMFVVQRLSPHFPHQASKTAIGHVIQLLYRASCFKLTKRDGDSSLMQLKEEYCSYEALRREHDTQIVSIALEAGLRISPDQWSSLLYGDTIHKSHMQSIIDKLQSPQSFNQSIQELVIALQRTGDPAVLSPLKQHFDNLAKIDPNSTTELSKPPTHAELVEILSSAKLVTFHLVEFLRHVFRSSSRNSAAAVSSTHGNGTNGNNGNGGNNKSRIGRVKPFVQRQQQMNEIMSPMNMDSMEVNHFQFPKAVDLSLRPCASVQPTRVITPVGMGGSHPGVMNPQVLQLAADHHKPIHLAMIAVHPQDHEHLLEQQQQQQQAQQSVEGEAGILQLSLSSEEDPYIPFDENPFVSKYGPISNKIVAHSHQGALSHISGSNNSGTLSTNVILGTTAVPSLTLIQPLQQLVLTTTTMLTDGQQHHHHQPIHFTQTGDVVNEIIQFQSNAPQQPPHLSVRESMD